MVSATATPLQFELCVRKKENASKHLPIVPNDFKPGLRGSHPAVAKEADRLNARNGAYFYFPETVPADWDRTHCDACKRIAVSEALADE